VISFILLIIVVLLVILFSIQNSAPVVISFLMWRFEASLAIVVFLSVVSGIIIALFFFLWRSIKKQHGKEETSKIKQKTDGL